MSFLLDVILSTPIWLVLFGSIFKKKGQKGENLKKGKKCRLWVMQ
jgi:hypothetical protein